MSDKLSTYQISRMDSLGQGVSKEADQITFISKTLPDEVIKASVYSKKKGVQFALLKELIKPSAKRIPPSCPHFNDCPSCHYLHTDYSEEFKFKTESLERMLRKIPHPEIQGIPAIRRDQYRNRIQLHYSRPQKLIGMLDVKNRKIAPIPYCMIPTQVLQEKLRELYQNNAWLNHMPKDAPQEGHVELYHKDDKIQLIWNKPYADGGFSQVFEEMNQILKDKMWSYYKESKFETVLDLFGGNGNLSKGFNYSKRLCVDSYPHSSSGEFFHCNLYLDNALSLLKQHLGRTNTKPDFILLDPPRSGFKELPQWLNEFKPKKLAYISCDPHTLVRDLEKLTNYKVVEVFLVDFFPSTFHFETMVFLEER